LLVNVVDSIYFDVKALDDERHIAFPGVSNKLIINNLEYLAGKDIDIIVRTPVVPGYNFIDLEKEICTLMEFVASLGIDRLELLPYHRFGEEKYGMLGREYRLQVSSLEIGYLREIVDKCKPKYFSVAIETPILT